LLKTDTDSINSYKWCDTKYEYDVSSWYNCVRLIKKDSANDNVGSFCLRHTDCNEKLPLICESKFFTLILNCFYITTVRETRILQDWLKLLKSIMKQIVPHRKNKWSII
jgi:hypothetical protein